MACLIERSCLLVSLLTTTGESLQRLALRPKTLATKKDPPIGGFANDPTAIVRGRSHQPLGK
jgi:hypothetical protein